MKLIVPRDSVWFCAFALIGCVTTFSISQGLTYPLFALILQKNGESLFVIGLNAAMTPLGIICSAPLLSKYANRFNRAHLIIASIFATILFLLLAGLFRNLWVWFILRFLLGWVINVTYTLSEATLLEIAPASHRGRLAGAYVSITNLGYAAGPVILGITGFDGMTPFIITSGILLIATTPLFVAPITQYLPAVSMSEKGSMFLFLRIAWILVFAYAATTLFDNAFLSLLPIYGIDNGVGERESINILFVILLGGAVTQVPVGWLIDRTSIVLLMSVCSMLGALGFLLFPIVIQEHLPVILVAFIWGAAVFSIQTIALSELGSRFKGKMLVAGNASFAMMWGVSGVVGVPASSAAMDIIGSNGLMFVVGGIFFVSTTLLIAETSARALRQSN